MQLGTNLDEVLNSDMYRDIRAKVLQGEKINGCSKCYQQEAAGAESLRTVTNEKYQTTFHTETTSASAIEFVELFLGDICNLKCVTCRPQLSTKWREDYRALGWALDKRVETKPVINIIKDLTGLKEIKLVGGEPLLDPQHTPLLKALVEMDAADMKLVYFTNGTVLPSQEVFSLWQKFREVEIYFSIDGVGEVNNYIRFPSQWKKVDTTLNDFLTSAQNSPNFVFRIATTISILNIWSMDDLESWFLNKQEKFGAEFLKQLIFNPLIDPDFLSVRKIPQNYIEKRFPDFENRSENQKKIINWIMQLQSNQYDPQLGAYLDQLDAIRNVSYKKALPDLDVFVSSFSGES